MREHLRAGRAAPGQAGGSRWSGAASKRVSGTRDSSDSAAAEAVGDLLSFQAKHFHHRFEQGVAAWLGGFLGERGNRAVEDTILEKLERPFDKVAILLGELSVQLREQLADDHLALRLEFLRELGDD